MERGERMSVINDSSFLIALSTRAASGAVPVRRELSFYAARTGMRQWIPSSVYEKSFMLKANARGFTRDYA